MFVNKTFSYNAPYYRFNFHIITSYSKHKKIEEKSYVILSEFISK